MGRIQVNTISAIKSDYSVTEGSDTISMTLNGKELEVQKQSAKVREVEQEEIQAVSQGIKQTTVAIAPAPTIGNAIDTSKVESLKEAKETVKEQILGTLNRLSEADYIKMKEENQPVEDYSKERFERTLDRIKSQRQFKREHQKEELSKKQESREELEDATKTIRKRLKEEQLPATESNIAKVAGAMELAAMSSSMTDASKAYVIDNAIPITPETIYTSRYSASTSGTSMISDAAWQELQPQVEQLLKQEGVSQEEQTLADAKWLLQQGLTISKETIKKVAFLNALGQESSNMLDLCIKNLSEGGEPKKTDLMEQSTDLSIRDKAASTVTMLMGIMPNAVDTLEEGDVVTIQALAQAEPASGTGSSLSQNSFTVTARRQLEEVRLKLTMEASYQLYKQGIEVDTREMSKLVEDLKALEDTYYRELSREYGIDAEEPVVQGLKETDQMVSALKKMPAVILGSTFDVRTKLSMAQLYEEGVKAQTEHVNKSLEYETLMTAPRKDLGDSIKKAFSKVGSILSDLNLEQSESNERAVRILAYNQMPINEASITDMKSYDLQVNQILSGMTPEVALTMIREGNNPMDLPLHEVNRMAQEISSNSRGTSEEKFSEYLYNLEKREGISKEERESYIGIYRLLHQVEKSDGAAVGAVIKADRELTLGNLLTAVRSKNQAGMDISVNETFDGIESSKAGAPSISEQVGKAFYGTALAKEAFAGLSVDTVAALEKEKKTLLDATLEELYEKEREVNVGAVSDYAAYQYESMRTVLESSRQSDLLVQANQEITVNTLEAAGYLLSERSTVYKEMKKVVSSIDKTIGERMDTLYDSFFERFGNKESLQDGYSQLEGLMKEAGQHLAQTDHVTAKVLEECRIYGNVIRLAAEVSKEHLFEVPVRLGEEIVTLKIQMVSATEGESNVSIHMEDERMGSFDVTAKIENGALSAHILCENRIITEYYKKQEEAIKSELEQTGVFVKQLVVTMNKKQTEFYDTDSMNNKEASSAKQLYEVAKVFVKTAKRAYQQ